MAERIDHEQYFDGWFATETIMECHEPNCKIVFIEQDTVEADFCKEAYKAGWRVVNDKCLCPKHVRLAKISARSLYSYTNKRLSEEIRSRRAKKA